MLVATLAMAGITAVALADEYDVDGDTVVGGTQSAVALTATPGQVLEVPAGLAISCQTKNEHMSASTTFSYDAAGSTVPAGGALSATSVTIPRPAGWPADGTNCPSGGLVTPTHNSTVSITAPATEDTYTYVLQFADDDADVKAAGKSKVTYTVTVAAPEPTDATAPVISRTIEGTIGDNGWYTSPVTVVWSVEDPESAVTLTGCGTQILSASGTSSCSATSDGGTSSDSVALNIDLDNPSIAGAPTTAPNANGWYNGDVVIDWTCSDGTSGIASCEPDSTITGEGENLTAEGNARDNAGRTATATSAPPVDIDRTGPTVTGTITSTPIDVSGTTWYRDTADVTFAATDGLSGVASGPTPASHTFGDGVDQSISSSATDNAGNPGSGSVTGVNVDARGPSVSAALLGSPVSGSWYKDSATVRVTASDPAPGSGLKVDPSGDTPITTNGVSTFGAQTAEDNVGHTASSDPVTVHVDAQGAGVTCNLARFTLGETGATVTGAATDGESGVDAAGSDLSEPADTSTVGTRTVTLRGADNVGHVTTQVCSYTVGYRWDGFLQPINDTAHQTGLAQSKFKLGQTVPVKFQLKAIDGTPVQAGAAPTFASKRIGSSCENTTDSESSVPVDAASTGSTFRYDATSKQYIYNFSTKGLAAGEWRVYASTDDGTTRTVDLCLTK